jgi:hypothetical protein
MRSYPLELRLLLSGSSFSVHRLRCGTRVNVRFRSTSDFQLFSVLPAALCPLADSCTATNDVHGLHWPTELRGVLRQVAGLGALDAGLSKSQIVAMQP